MWPNVLGPSLNSVTNFVAWDPSPSYIPSLHMASWATVMLSVSVLVAAEDHSKVSDLLWKLLTKTESGFKK